MARYGDLLRPFRHSSACGIDRGPHEKFRTVTPIPTDITDADGNVFKNDKAIRA